MLERFTWFKQSAFLWKGDGLNVYIDPWGITDGSPAADAIFITHAHFDHFEPDDIAKIRSGSTKFFAPADVAAELSGDVTAVAPGDSFEVSGIRAQAVPAYNTVEDRLGFHPRSNKWVGYILELGDSTIYHAGDTDHIDDLNSVKADVSFVPIGGTYTMDHTEAAGLVKAISPQLAVPMHFGSVVGQPSDAEAFKRESAPVPVEILTPEVPFA